MSVMSKTAITCSIAICTCLVFEQDLKFVKHVKSCIFWNVLKEEVICNVQMYSFLVHQQKVGTLFLKGASRRQQVLNYLDGHDLSKWITENEIQLRKTFSKGLEQPHAETGYKTKPLGMPKLRLRKLFADLEFLTQSILGLFLPQMSDETFAKIQRKVRTLILQVALISIESQKLNDSKGYSDKNGFILAKYFAKDEEQLLTIFLKELQECLADTGYTRKASKNLEDAEYLCESRILNLINLLIGFETKKYTKDLNRPMEVCKTPCYNKVSNDSKFNGQDDQRRLLEICSVCQEMISKKKFFYERRFGILSKCNCVICYGCIRRVFTLDGAVKQPIKCPSCSVKSDIVASSARWIDSKEKVKFFEAYRKNTEYAIKMKLGWTGFRTAGKQWNK